MTKHNKQKKRSYQYSHALADLPLTYQKALKSAIMDMVVSANSELQTHRQISPYSAVIVASRSLQTSSSSTKPAARVFAAVRAVNSFINLSRTGKPGVERLSNTDLLPVAHPLSTRSHEMTEASLRAARAQWLAADPRIDDSLRNLVAAAYSQAPGSVEHRHAFTRISVLPAGAVPRDIRIDADLQLTPIIAVLGLDGNSDAARSLRAKLQRRDRKGRFAEMGGGWSFKLRLPDGLFKTVSGRVVGASGTDAIEIEVTGSKDLDDGIYTMPSAKGESVKAVLPTKAVEELPDRDDAMDDVYVDSASLTRKDAPSGWKQIGKTQQKGRTLYSEYTSDDGYTVKREARQSATGTGVEYGYSVRRMEAKDTDPFARDKKVMRSWSDVQKAVLADQDDYKRDLEALSPPAGEPQFTVKNSIPKGDGVSIQFGLAEFEDDENFPDMVKRANDLGGFVEVGPPDFTMGGDGTITVTFDKPRLTKEDAKKFLGGRGADGAFYARFDDESEGSEYQELFDELTKGTPGEPPAGAPDEPPAGGPSFTSPEAARDILEEGALTAEGILTDIDDADLDDLDDDDAKILEKVNKLSDSAQEALDNIDPVGSQLNDIYFDQARADLGELAELLSNATNPDMQDAGFVLKEAVDKYLSLPTIDFSGRRAELEVAVEPSALDGVVQEVNALLDSYDSGAVDASGILDLLGEAIDDVPNNDQIYNSLKKQVENVELRGFSIEKAKSNAEKSIRKLASEEGAVPYLTVEKTPSAPETNDPVDESLFDDTFITSDDSYKLNVFDQYSPRGRVDQDSVDYTDDPQILANSFTAENLQKALRQALVPSSDGDIAVGLGYLPFDGGDEAVPAEALYEALDFAGIDSDIVVAGIYDSALPEGSETNVERITMLRDDFDKIGGEEFNPADINTARDWEIKQAIKRNGELATPQRAALAVEQMTDAAKNEEKNPSIKEVADDLINRQNDPNLNEYSAENLGNVLDSYMPWSFSDSADEREAFRGFWGMLMSIDGGSTNDMDDKRPVQSTSGFRRAVYESVKRQSGGDEEVALAEYDRLISEYGGYPEWTRGKEAISDGDADIFSDPSSAGAFFRLIAASAKKNDVRLQRYIDVRKDDPALQQYLTPGVVLPIDARSFTTRNEAAEDIVSLLKYPPNSETTHIVFEIQPNEGTSISFASVSWFSGEAEHIAWGNYEVDSTRRVEMGGRTDLTVVSLRQVSASGADADGGAADSDIFGPGDDAAVETPAKPNVANWDKVGPQLGSNLGGTYEDPDGDIYYVKESKSLKHAENEALASAFYKELGVNAVDVRVGEADGAPRTVSPIVSTTGETLADRLNDREFIDKIGEDFAIDAWLGNYDVAGLVYDNIVVDNDGNPLRVDPGGALLFRARGAEKGDMFGDSVGEIDTLVDPDINPSASRVFGGMTEEQRKASAQKLLDITPQRIDQIVDSIVTDPGMAEGLKDRLKKRRADVLNRFDIEDSVLNMPEVAQRPTAPVDKSPESIEAFKDELARFTMDKAIAKGWNCEGGLTSAATNPCDLPSVNELIAEATPTAAELAEPKPRQLPSDEEVNNAFDSIFDDIETYLGSDWGLDGTDKSKYKKTRTKIEDIRERYDAGEITREEAAAELAALRDEISASGGEPIAKEATAEAIDHIIKNLDGTIYDPVVVIDKDLPPPGSGLGLSKDKVTVIKPGMTVKSKDGMTYVVNRYDPANWNYVYVKPTDGSKEKIKSTKTLEIIGGEEGGGGGTPAAPEPGGPELPKAEAPKGAPKAPETPSAVEKPEVPFPDDMPLAPRAPEPPKSAKDKQQGVVGPGAAPVIIEDALPYTESGIAGTPSLADAFAYAASDAPNAAIVGSYAAIDSTDIEDMSVRVTRLQPFDKPEPITRMKFKLTAWAGEKLFRDIKDLKRNEYTTIQGVSLEHISRKNTVVPELTTDMKVYDNWRHGTTYEAELPNGVKIKFFRGASGSYTDHVFSRSVEDYDEVVNALNNYVIVDVPDGVDLDDVGSALNIAGVVDPRPSVEQDFRILIENRLMSVLGGKTNASRNEARPEVRQEILSEVKTKYGIGVEDVYVGIGANGRIEMKISKEKAAALAKEAKIEIAEHNLTVSAGYHPDPELAATKIADIIAGPNRALMSTLARWTEGVSSSGQSSETDMATGGADYVFFSPKDMTVTSSIGYGVSDASDATVTFDAVDLFTRLDFYANYVDTYGARSEQNDNLKNAAPGGYELMFKDRVSTDILKDIVVHTRVVPFLIKELNNRGITEINGRPVEEVVTVGGQGVVMEKDSAIKKFQTKLDENLKTRFGEDFSGAKKYKDWLNEDPSGRAKEYAPPVDENAVIVAVKDLNDKRQERVIVRLTNGAYLSYTRYTGAIGAPFTYEYQEIENDFPGWSYIASDEQSKGSN